MADLPRGSVIADMISIAGHRIGPGNSCFIIAEAGVNHNGNLDTALKLVDAAKEAGADAVKFQTFTAEALATIHADTADYHKKNTGKVELQFAVLKRLELPREFYPKIMAHCSARDILFLSTPFSIPDADFLETLRIAAYKIPSGEITNLPYLRHIGKKGKPMIVSTGMADLVETKAAVQVIQSQGNQEIVVLHSTSNYPPSYEGLNLNVITTLQQEFAPEGIPVGYSDNGSKGIIAEVAAVALGASVIEKHFTLDRGMEGPDHLASLEPAELKTMVRAVRDTEVVLGSADKRCTPEEEPIKRIARKSIVARRDIAKGERFMEENITTKRPEGGLSPMLWDSVVGKIASRDFVADDFIVV